ncbi:MULTISPECIES: AfsA-related hotdog domain-containing protein [unclassified Rhodococcus (in: high G+C Gram-positive bacteria)]|uniref:AfsA-related hotdog domain-containing protein n=1 Tax=unclassified Rhodococcus (in: high G+C Gram-positive bacteria) TaxID=192944 RepID=UPI001445DC32|nr:MULTISPECIES: AfsA-related hotdog domain-containing protein [unclassified Rhodococcus (in: high G+C Gram-positive bacteria)]
MTDYSIGPGPAYVVVVVQLPFSHRVFDVSNDEYDPLGVAEAFHHTVVLRCHTNYDIPLHYRSFMEKFSLEVLDTLRMQSRAAPLTFDVEVNDVTHRHGAVSDIDFSGMLTNNVRDIARCSALAQGESGR